MFYTSRLISEQASRKHKWDNQNVLNYAVSTAEARGVEKGKLAEVAIEMKNDGLPLIQIVKFTKLSIEEIETP